MKKEGKCYKDEFGETAVDLNAAIEAARAVSTSRTCSKIK